MRTVLSHHADCPDPPCGPSGPTMRTVRPHHADRPDPPCGLSGPTMRTVRTHHADCPVPPCGRPDPPSGRSGLTVWTVRSHHADRPVHGVDRLVLAVTPRTQRAGTLFTKAAIASQADVAQTLLSVLRPEPLQIRARVVNHGETQHRQECLCHIGLPIGSSTACSKRLLGDVLAQDRLWDSPRAPQRAVSRQRGEAADNARSADHHIQKSLGYNFTSVPPNVWRYRSYASSCLSGPMTK
jgi:hypothetical protein